VVQKGGFAVVSKTQMSTYKDNSKVELFSQTPFLCTRPEELFVNGEAVLGREIAHAMSIPEQKRILVRTELEDDCNSEL